ncbi:CACTA en-spm transposon protein [Cucumis melo var. makuwa]|uniref:CACTA en-spm transposon protein n=1 Tax=Cucumis melo var. makuwa TaxID=1194695 RepID=A0A5A7V7P7_CUCMM|nr:CACTA en-spm transposon protein [Cucumis melo var. makuwa]
MASRTLSGVMGDPDAISDSPEMASGVMGDPDAISTMSSFSRGFHETDAIFLEFAEDLDNLAGGSSSVDDNSGTSQPSATPTPKEKCASRLLDFERNVGANGWIPKPMGGFWCGEAHFPTRCSLQPCDRFVDHQLLNTFKEFWGDSHRHFKKYSDPKEACANPTHLLVESDED